ncbi:unnamed protein product [Didymodactylos carnosus]|uniref:Uncharacterized protein n=1 Tax=Didymodactylos carnosus TaxID=1234261 RepID=A0A814UGG7_9BILA|nr:unnamed protein product [Didymodactylos carnosus]CAF1230467.1 unnamed protein product [Didymodactylos carnosus]CAF3938984.1 unnamed protein product [Didymodactylos carnosus]CAF4038497.1 unnamed protein product [Didymodactylos carnosus]
MVYLLTIFLVAASAVMDILLHRITNDTQNNNQLICVTEYSSLSSVWKTVDTLSIFTNHIVPVLLNLYASGIIPTIAARSKSNVSHESFISSLWFQIKLRYEQLLCSLLMILCSLPQLLAGFILRCDIWNIVWLKHFIISLYYFAYISQLLMFFLFIQPSRIYKQAFKQSQIGKFVLNNRVLIQ